MTSLSDAKHLALQIGKLVNVVDFPGSDRAALAGACYHIALDHHEAVVRLIELGIHVSALALVRPQVEAFIRGAWIQHVANDGDIERVRKDEPFPKQWAMITALEATDVFPGDRLSSSHTANWKCLHTLTHPGAGLIAMVLKDGRVERNCDEKYVNSALTYTGLHALFAAAGIMMLAENSASMQELVELTTQFILT